MFDALLFYGLHIILSPLTVLIQLTIWSEYILLTLYLKLSPKTTLDYMDKFTDCAYWRDMYTDRSVDILRQAEPQYVRMQCLHMAGRVGAPNRYLSPIWKYFPYLTLTIITRVFLEGRRHLASITPEDACAMLDYKNPMTRWYVQKTLGG
jgi:hypothetical protein